MTFSRFRSPLSVLALTLVLAGAAFLAVACAPDDDSDPADGTASTDTPAEVPEYTIDQFMENTSLQGLSFSPDGSKILVSTDETGVFNAYAWPVEGGEPEQLTESTTDPVFVVSWMPDGESILYSSDQGGNELNHLYLLGPDGEVRDLTPGEELKAGFYGWARDRESFFVGSNERDARYFDVYEYDAETLERELLYQDDEGLGFGGVSPDRRYIAFGKPYSTSDSDVFLVDLESGEKKNLTEHEGFQQNDPMGFTPDGESLLIRTDEGSEFAYVEKYDLESGETETLMEAEWDVAGADYSEDGKYLAVWINNDARTEIQVYEAEGMERVTLPDLPRADITDLAFSRDESKIGF